jgi:pimeloyl-ACP methyl ester carboxylesterase
MRSSGELLELGRQISCPVVALHGDYDPHPADGVRGPLASVLSEFRFVLLERCGHMPWIERQARERFFEVLEEELETA